MKRVSFINQTETQPSLLVEAGPTEPLRWAKDAVLLQHTRDSVCCAFVAVRGAPVAATTRALCGEVRQGDTRARLSGDSVCARCGAELLRMARENVKK